MPQLGNVEQNYEQSRAAAANNAPQVPFAMTSVPTWQQPVTVILVQIVQRLQRSKSCVRSCSGGADGSRQERKL